MAHFTIRHLDDHISEKFLESKGFILVHHVTHSCWIRGGIITLYLRTGDVVSTEDMLMEKIASQSFNEGRKRGKQDAVEELNRRLTELVFPPVKDIDQSYN